VASRPELATHPHDEEVPGGRHDPGSWAGFSLSGRNERILSGVCSRPASRSASGSAIGFEGHGGGVSGTSLNALYGYLVDY
jgi:hypothetical protein